MTANVSKIKECIYVSNDMFHQQFMFFISIGEKETARKLLINQIKSDEYILPASYHSSESSSKNRDELFQKYDKYMQIVDLHYNPDVLDAAMTIYFGDEYFKNIKNEH